MTKMNRCPRCGEVFTDDFCPNCDLHFTSRGVFRPQEDQLKHKKENKQNTEIGQTKQPFFEKREPEEGTFSKDIFNKTVGEVIAENHLKYDYNQVLTSFNEDLNHKEKDSEEQEASKEEIISKEEANVKADDSNDVLVEYLSSPDDNEQEHHKEEEFEKIQNEAVKQTLVSNNQAQKKTIIITLSVATLCIVLLIFGVNFYQQQQNKKMIHQKETTIEKKINAFYVDNNPKNGFIKTAVTKEKTAPIVELIDSLKAKDKAQATKMEKQLATLENNYELEQKVNQLFVVKRISKDKVNDVAVKENVSIQMVEKKNPTTQFEKAVNESIRDAKQQKQEMQKASTAVKALINQGTVSQKATLKQYEAAKKLVDVIENKEVKKDLNNQLKTVKTTIEKRKEEEKLAKERAAAEKKAAQEAEKQAQEQASLTKESKEAAQKAKADPTNGDNPEATSSDPYTWEKGIKTKVINTCINRGYITPDAYTLRKAYEYNGDGYYNLYSTKGNKDTYLVTINCKTGWFKGNG